MFPSQHHRPQAEIKISFPIVSTSQSKQQKPIQLDRGEAVNQGKCTQKGGFLVGKKNG